MLCVLALAALCFAEADEEFAGEEEAEPVVYSEKPTVFLRRDIKSKYAVMSKELMVEYSVFNNGDQPLLSFTLTDESFATEEWEPASPVVQHWDVIAA